MSSKILFGFHAITVRLKTAPKSILEIHVDASRRDQRMPGGSVEARIAALGDRRHIGRDRRALLAGDRQRA